jgi:membrane protein DedA with SNARE-associated domain
MTLGALVAKYGYWLLAADSLLEGETILVLAGFAVRRGHLYLLAVLGIAALASFVGNQFYFWLGRRHGPAVLVRWPSVAQHFERIHRLVAHHPAAVIVGIRFVYGLRIAGPVVIGMSPISGCRFGWLNALGAVLWACLVAGVGWAFGRAAELALDEIRQVEMWLLLGLVLAAVIAAWTRRDHLRWP